jgi:hypothetical protein
MRSNDKRQPLPLIDAIRDLSRYATHISLEEAQTIVYDLEHSAPLSQDCALARAFLAWRKQLEHVRKSGEW